MVADLDWQKCVDLRWRGSLPRPRLANLDMPGYEWIGVSHAQMMGFEASVLLFLPHHQQKSLL